MSSARSVAVLDHGMGNLRSVAKALEAAGANATITSDRAFIENADALCVPGQGIFGRCIENMVSDGFDGLVREWIAADRPFLGICLGMQVLFGSSDENDAPGLDIFDGHVARLSGPVRVPHIGWNEVEATETSTVETGYFYFDHSYAVSPTDTSIVSGWCEHGRRFAAAIEAGSLLGVQFHPEKSGVVGIELLRGWVERAALQEASMERHT